MLRQGFRPAVSEEAPGAERSISRLRGTPHGVGLHQVVGRPLERPGTTQVCAVQVRPAPILLVLHFGLLHPQCLPHLWKTTLWP